MRKKRWKKILIWTVSIILLLGIGGLFTANYMMDKMIASLADSLESELIEDTLAEAPVETDKPTGEAPTPSNTTEDPQNTPTPNEEATNGGSASSDTPSSTTKPAGDSEYTAEISTDKAKNVQEKITVSEKAKLASVFLKELSMDDIKALQELASGGLNLEEKKAARSLILEKLSPEQYDELIQIAKKYGMSQGKSYSEVSKEE
ncbi:hypothetical protein D3P08_26725 [Paenibacillus nanensis]|uniref:Uncharacterized protein n=1 Tax=Paenibacillus nanensis TaxID=393251 RepID=A0A3A1UJR5_9BACL|nr:hypothetical protein [Paenibacillus nanensis]RIX45878.1 hypothetical protein D3P08_26725 [Paenibacillus nanensis]